jgi:hypothetical protein
MSNPEPTLDELFEDGRAIDEALKEAARDARRLHKALGNPMATWKDGQVVWVRPEDIDVVDDSEQKSNQLE